MIALRILVLLAVWAILFAACLRKALAARHE
jgi:hypothetical protein